MNGRKGMMLSLVLVAAMSSPLMAQQDTTPKQQHVATAAHKMHRATTAHRSMYPRLRQERPGLLKQTTLTPDSATHVALGQEEGGRVVARRLVKRGDHLVYVISVRPKGAKVSKRIDVDAKTGSVLETEPTRTKAPAKTKVPAKTKAPAPTKG
jgi:uncharacterized membrane protein YkoI